MRPPQVTQALLQTECDGIAHGGGIYADGAVVISQSTITDNHAIDGMATGGGLFHTDTFSNNPVSIEGSILAANTAGDGADLAIDSNILPVVNYSLIGVADGLTFVGNVGNLTGAVATPLDPKLGPLANLGGLTSTHFPLAGSPVIDAGDPSISFDAMSFDQRGEPFARVVDGDDVAGPRIDIGAVERRTFEGFDLIVDSVVDGFDGDFSAGQLSLREAIALANLRSGADVVTFSNALSGATIKLNGSALGISDALIIDARPLAQGVTIDANQESIVFSISSAASNMITLGGLTLTGGIEGGAIRSLSSGPLMIDQCTIVGNKSFSAGGGIYTLGDVTLSKSDVIENVSEHGGSGIHAEGNVSLLESTVRENRNLRTTAGGSGIYARGSVVLTRSMVSDHNSRGIDAGNLVTLIGTTVSGNQGVAAGGILAGGNVSLTDSAVRDNTTTAYGGRGGGIHSFGNVTLTTSTVSGNMSGNLGGGIYAMGAVSLTQSIISENRTLGSLFDSAGGGIYARGVVTLLQSTVTGNSAEGSFARGGGIHADDSVAITGNRSRPGEE